MNAQEIRTPAIPWTRLQDIAQSTRKAPTTLKAGLIIIGVILLVSLFAPLLTPYDPIIGDFNDALASPSLKHPFGTDSTGRDVLSRTLYAARLDLQIGLITTYVPLVIGLALGATAGFFGGWFENLLMRLVDIAIAFPFIVLIIVILAILGPGLQNMYIAVFLLAWTMYARLARAEMLVVREQEYIMAARALGYPSFTHHFPPCPPQRNQLLSRFFDVRYRPKHLARFGDQLSGNGCSTAHPRMGRDHYRRPQFLAASLVDHHLPWNSDRDHKFGFQPHWRWAWHEVLGQRNIQTV